MGNKVLVAYASKRGATAEIAEKIGVLLRESGLAVDVVEIQEEMNLTPYAAVVLGSAVYIGRWQKEAVKFLETNEAMLAERAVWIFSSGPTGQGDPVELLDGWQYPEKIQPVLDHIQPRDVAVFHGELDLSKLNFLEKRMVKGVEAPVGDFRDWQMIGEWAREISSELAAVK